MQVSKGLKRATGRDEQVQHHLGTLNFRTTFVCSGSGRPPAFPMAVAPKTAHSPTPVPSTAETKVDLPAPEPVPEAVQLDFAANPNHYRAKAPGKPKKVKPRVGARADRSPRLELGLEVQFDEDQEKDTEKE